MMPNPSTSIERVYFLTPKFVEVSGVAASLSVLAVELARRGIDVWVGVRQPVQKDNQYRKRLKDHSVNVISPPRILAFLDRVDWHTRDRVLVAIARVIRLFIVPVIVIDAVVQRRALRQSWRGALGRVNNLLNEHIGPYLDRLPQLLDCVYYAMIDRLARRRPPDIVEVSGASFLRTLSWAHKHRIPVVYKHCETPDEWTVAQDAHLALADCVIAKSASSKAALQGMSRYEGKILVIPNAFDSHTLEQDCGSRARAPQSQTEGTHLIYVGRLSPEKGVQFLPQMLSEVREQIQDVTLTVVGNGPLEDQVRETCLTLGLGDCVQFQGAVSHRDALCVLQEADILLFPSLTEGLPNVIIEAMACGKPIVATDIAGTRDLVTNGSEALLVPPADPGAMAASTVKLIRNPELSNRLGKAALARFNNGTWSAEVLGDRTLAAYDYARRVHRNRTFHEAGASTG